MRLVRVSIEGYRSIKERLDVTLDPHVTVLLGANDHGKTNFLQALRHLNEGVGFETDDVRDHAKLSLRDHRKMQVYPASCGFGLLNP